MGLFDNLKNKAAEAVKSVTGGGSQKVDVVFETLPDTLEQFKALPQAALATPFDTAALTVLALCFYPQDKELCYSMLEFLSGPREVTPREKQFIRDRFMDGTDYIPRSYFKGAVPGNDYTPSEPYRVEVLEYKNSRDNENYLYLYIPSGGADNPRQVQLRKKPSTGEWFIWAFRGLLMDIRVPVSQDSWA